MNPVLRTGLGIALASVIAMILFSLTGAEYAALGPVGRINVIVIPTLLLLGTLYDYRIVFDKANETVTIRSGLVIAGRTRTYRLDEVQQLVIRTINPRKRSPDQVDTGVDLEATGFRPGRAFIGFLIGGRLEVLDRACSLRRARGWVMAFRAFMPFSVEEGE